MKSHAAALVGLCIVAADLGAQTRSRGPAPAEIATFAREEAIDLEQQGTLSDSSLRVILAGLRETGRAGTRADMEPALTRSLFIRALGRLERRDLIAPLMPFATDASVSDAAHLALALALRASTRPDQPDEELSRAATALIPSAPASLLGQLPYTTREQFQAAEARLAAMLEEPKAPRAAAARGLEALARRHRKLGPLSPDTLALLDKAAAWELPAMSKPGDEPVARESFAALVAAGVVDAERLAAALGEDSALFRRLGAFALFGTGTTVSGAERTKLTRVALDDPDYTVRFDGLRAWIRRETEANGCGPIVDALADQSLHLVLAGIDALADRCTAGEGAGQVTERLLAELRVPPNAGSWHREAHAIVAAARRAPDRAAALMPAFRGHDTWQVRMYAARAAEPLKDLFTLEKLAYDDHDNVREAALMPLQRLAGVERSQAAFIAALGRADYQLVLTAANGVKGQTSSRDVVTALADALARITAQKSDTSRDTRLALMARLREAGSSQAPVFEKLLTDFDSRVAEEAALALRGLTGGQRAAAPNPVSRNGLLERGRQRLLARVELESGRSFDIRFDTSIAPLAYGRLQRLVREKYYDGLTFHRVVPNYVIQGGSPGANEYAGDARFMRDELSTRPHSRGTVGLSTRGHHTGDAQIFINLADNRTLDLDYTVVGAVDHPGMAIVDTIQEGTRITRIRMVPAGK